MNDGRHVLFRPTYIPRQQDGGQAAWPFGGEPSTAQFQPGHQYYAQPFAGSHWDRSERQGLTMPPGHEREGAAPLHPLFQPPPPWHNLQASNLDASAPAFVPRDTTSNGLLPSGGVSLHGIPPPPPPPPPEDDVQPSHSAQPPPLLAAQGYGFTAINQQTLPERPKTDISLRKGSLYRQPAPRARKQAPPRKTPELTPEPIPEKEPEASPKRPEPSETYVSIANGSISGTDETARQLLIILDLNGTLLHRPQIGGSKFNARPNVDKFLQYLFGNHHVMIWSSATSQNVRAMAAKLLSKEQRSKLIACWGRDTLHLSKAQYKSKVQVYKQLHWVWSNADIQGKNRSERPWNQTNTVLIDDSKDKAASEPYNLVRLDEFDGENTQPEVCVLGQVVEYLDNLRKQPNVSAYMRSLPFRQDEYLEFDWDTMAWKEYPD